MNYEVIQIQLTPDPKYVAECGNAICFTTIKEDCERRLAEGALAMVRHMRKAVKPGYSTENFRSYVQMDNDLGILRRWYAALDKEGKRRAKDGR